MHWSMQRKLRNLLLLPSLYHSFIVSILYIMSYSVVIPSNRSFHHIEPLLQSLANQVVQPSQIVIVHDQYATVEEFEEYTSSISTVF